MIGTQVICNTLRLTEQMDKWIKWGVKLTVSVGLLYWASHKIYFNELLLALLNYKIGTVTIAFLFYFLGSITLHSSILLLAFKLPVKEQLRLDNVNLVMRSCSLFLPGYIVSAIRWKVYNRLGFSKTSSLKMMLVNRFHQIFTSSLLITVIGSFIFFQDQGESHNYILFLLLAVALAMASLFVLAMSCNINSFFSGFIIDFFQFKSQKIRKALVSLYSDGKSIGVVRFLMILSFSLLSVVCVVYCQYLLLSSVMDVYLIHVALARSVVQIILVLPISVAGLGVREAGFIGVLALFGYDPSLVFSFTVVLLTYQVLLFILGMFLYLKDKAVYRLLAL